MQAGYTNVTSLSVPPVAVFHHMRVVAETSCERKPLKLGVIRVPDTGSEQLQSDLSFACLFDVSVLRCLSAMLSAYSGFLLVDDDPHSARLLKRTLSGLSGQSVEWIGDVDGGLRQIKTALSGPDIGLFTMIIVDVKDSSRATADFVARIPGQRRGIPVVAMAFEDDPNASRSLLQAGADAVFVRRADRLAYRAEVAAIVEFQRRWSHLDMVGT